MTTITYPRPGATQIRHGGSFARVVKRNSTIAETEFGVDIYWNNGQRVESTNGFRCSVEAVEFVRTVFRMDNA